MPLAPERAARAPAKPTAATKLTAPATLWGQQVLALHRDFDGGAAGNAFEVKVALAYLRQCSVPATVTSSYSANQVTHRFAFPPNLVL